MTTPATATDPVLVRFRQVLEEAYGPRLERAVLFGSRARGDAREDSDYDVAVFLHDLVDRDAEVDRLGFLQSRMIDEMDVFVHTMPFRAGAWAERTSLMRDVREEGRDL